MRYAITAAVLVALAACGGGNDVEERQTPEGIAAAIGAEVKYDATDNDPLGRELSARWHGEWISIWVAANDAAYAQGLVIVEATGFPYTMGEGWVIVAETQEVADAAAAALSEGSD